MPTKLKYHNTAWTKEDLRHMRGMARNRFSARQVAGMIGRTTGAVKFKAMVEGIRFRAINQPQGTQRRRKQRALLSRLATRRHARAAA